MKKTYQQPEIWVEELEVAFQVLAGSTKYEVTQVDGADLKYGGGGDGPARAGASSLWDEEDDSSWDNK
ncbi:MAG: hypothetical protein J6Y23_02710 [Prevotella sp.]|nr:hypothetical protein [Prevotella sp.]